MADVPLMSNPMTTTGDIIKGGTSGAAERLAVGTDGHVLKLVSGAPAWSAEAGGGGLSAPKAWVEDEFDARDYPGTPGAVDVEFNSSTLTGTALGAPDVIDADTTFPGKLNIEEAGSAFGLVGRYWSWSPTGGAKVRAMISGAGLVNNFQRYGLIVSTATPGATRGIYLEVTTTGVRRISSISSTSLTGGASFIAAGGTNVEQIKPPIWLQVEYVSATSLQFWYSLDGQIFEKFGSAHTHALTIASVGLVVSGENSALPARGAFNYLRSV